MVKYLKYGLVATVMLLIIIIITTGVRSCFHAQRTRQDNITLKRQVQGYKETIKAVKKEKQAMEQRITKRNEQIKEYRQDIIDLQYESDQLETQMEEESHELKKLKKKFTLIRDDKDAKIANLKLQVKSLERSLSLAKKDIRTVKQKADEWELAYKKQVETSADLRRQLILQEQANQTANSLIDRQDKKIKKLERQKRLYQIGIGVAVGLGLLLGGN